ncbi:glycoside hydrolase family 5 protein [Marinilabilia salmonicolor]|uniref:glycoside hydrolase family 5 protein n=1 Tax=Marinilabilia salmonicolor TaxID=989 RepID=UPI00029ACA4D|nr:glycoside hydrolase family 5 protein [Marinilabilia salmonicolor]
MKNYRGLKALLKITMLLGVISMLNIGCSKDENNSDKVPDGEEPTTGEVLTAKEVVKNMGAGFNIGNTFDNGIQSTNPAELKPLIDLYHDAGMNHVRIPVTWMERFSSNLADADGNVNTSHSRLLELKELVDYAIGLNMYVVINTHHEHWLKDNYDGSDAMDAIFTNLWTDIANFFKDYDHHLIFEVLNEPEGELGEWNGDDEGFPAPTNSTALSYVRKVNEVGYNAIRNAGGNNETRTIMVSTNAQGNSSMIDEVYPSKSYLPGDGNDKYLAIQVHSYDPWSFCGQTGSNSAYPGNASVRAAILNVSDHAATLNVPVNYGEFGVGRESNQSERNTNIVRGYYATFAQTTLSEDMSYSVWDDRGWFGLVTGSSSNGYSFLYNIVPTMLE